VWVRLILFPELVEGNAASAGSACVTSTLSGSATGNLRLIDQTICPFVWKFKMRNSRILMLIFVCLAVLLSTNAGAQTAKTSGIVGDGQHDDSKGIQALLDTRQSMVYLPPPPVRYLISQPLQMHSQQTLRLDLFTVIRLKDSSDCPMITNDNHTDGNENIALIGGIWDMHNEGQSLCEYQKTRNWHGSYDPARYLGVLMRFNHVKNLTLRGLTFKDPVTYSAQLGNLDQFTVSEITFDHNLKRSNMDGIHVHGNSYNGQINNLKGTTNDDLVALNADDAGIFEMSRGPIENIVVDGIWSTDGYTAVRLLSAGSPLRRIRLKNIFGTYRYNVVSFTNHKVHPGSASTFDDISISALCCAKSGMGMKFDPAEPGKAAFSLIWIDAPAVVSGLTIAGLNRQESVWPAATILIEPGVVVNSLQLSQVNIYNFTAGPLDMLVNGGTIGQLDMNQVRLETVEGEKRGMLLRNSGEIKHSSLQQISVVNTIEEIEEEPAYPKTP
jgi:hypothetical protein